MPVAAVQCLRQPAARHAVQCVFQHGASGSRGRVGRVLGLAGDSAACCGRDRVHRRETPTPGDSCIFFIDLFMYLFIYLCIY